MTQRKIYLAGPEVFLTNVADVAEAKKKLCLSHGFTGVFPLDAEIAPDEAEPASEHARRIAEANENLMRGSDCLIANCTPFRGPSMDIGTGYEIGFMRGLGRPVFGYANVSANYQQRTDQYNSALGEQSVDPYTAGTEVESFDLGENLMISIALGDHDGAMVRRDVAPGTELTDLAGFEQCLVLAKTFFSP